MKAAAGDPEEGRRVRSREETLQELAGMIIQFDQLFVDAKRSDTGMATLGKGFFWEWATRCRDVLALIDADRAKSAERDKRLADLVKDLANEIETHENDDMTDGSEQFFEVVKSVCLFLQMELSNTQTEPEGSRA